MPPKRKLSEILTQASLNRRVCIIFVEGDSDRVVIRSFLEGAALPSIIYPIAFVEIDSFQPSGIGGHREKVIQVSEFVHRTDAKRIVGIVDRDDHEFIGFRLRARCLMTDLSCVEIYPFEFNDCQGFVSRAFYVDLTNQALTQILVISRCASVLRWLKERKLAGRSLANVEGSLEIRGDVISLDVSDWVNRSVGAAADRQLWNSLEGDLRESELTFPEDHRAMINVHMLDVVFRYWLRQKKIRLTEGWVEQFLRGRATYDCLAKYEFFAAVAAACRADLEQS
jgi:hypothetical protein